MEVDLKIDVDSKNYDKDFGERLDMTKQVCFYLYFSNEDLFCLHSRKESRVSCSLNISIESVINLLFWFVCMCNKLWKIMETNNLGMSALHKN